MNMAKKVPIVQATFYNNNTKQIENCYPMTSAKGVVMSDGKTLEESFSDKADNSVVVHKSGDEEVLGRKTFDDLRANGFCLSNNGDWNRWVSAFYSFLENKGIIQFGTEEDWSVILRNIADPEYENDAATKGYVDTKIGDASIPVLQYGALINNNIPSVFEREEHAIANAPIYAKILSGEVQFFAAKIGGVGLFVSRSISSNKSSFELIGLDFKNLAEILITINIDQSGLTQAVTLSKNLQSALTDTDGGYGQRVAELETGKQDTLTAGNGIIIEQNVISAIGGSGGGGSVDLSEYAKTVDVNAGLATKQDKISDLATIREGAAKGATALQSETDPIYSADKPSLALKSEIPDISGKQDKISDLDTIRSGAAKGATALQSYTETDPVYTADKPSIALKSEIPDISGKADKTAIVTETEGNSSYRIAPNRLTRLGTLASNVTLSLNTASEEAGVVNVYDIIFSTPAAAPSITWPEGISWVGGSAPAIAGGKTYEVNITDNLATYGEFSV